MNFQTNINLEKDLLINENNLLDIEDIVHFLLIYDLIVFINLI